MTHRDGNTEQHSRSVVKFGSLAFRVDAVFSVTKYH